MVTRSTSRAKGLLLLSVGALIACKQGVDVNVAKSGSDVSFAIREFSSSAGACVDVLDVSLADPASPGSLWEVATADPALCVGQFTYGRTPVGFAQTAPAVALKKGQTYLVEVSGTGFIGSKRFIVGDSDGPIGRD